jgi:hypothetical protein
MRPCVFALAILCTATVATAQNPDPLPARLTGSYTVMVGANNKMKQVPVELTDIKMDGGKVTGIVANYRSPNGNCVADKTPFDGTYKDGQLSIKSTTLVSQRPDGNPCGSVFFDVKVSAGRASGTYKAGPLGGPIEFDAK